MGYLRFSFDYEKSNWEDNSVKGPNLVWGFRLLNIVLLIYVRFKLPTLSTLPLINILFVSLSINKEFNDRTDNGSFA